MMRSAAISPNGLSEHGWRIIGLMPSPIEGGDGNREFLIGAHEMD